MAEIKQGQSSIPKQKKIDLLREVCQILNRSGIDYFLTCGTLLGYIREGDFIHWDTDIDLGVFELGAFEKIIPDLEAANLSVTRYAPKHGIPMSLSYQILESGSSSGKRPHVDIFKFERTSRGIIFKMVNTRWTVEKVRRFILHNQSMPDGEGSALHESVDAMIRESRLPSPMVGSLTKIKRWVKRYFLQRQYQHRFEPFYLVNENWFDIQVKIPSNAEDHLRLFYGESWRIPNRDYSQSLERQNNIRRVKL